MLRERPKIFGLGVIEVLILLTCSMATRLIFSSNVIPFVILGIGYVFLWSNRNYMQKNFWVLLLKKRASLKWALKKGSNDEYELKDL